MAPLVLTATSPSNTMPDNSLNDQLKQAQHAQRLGEEREIMDATGASRSDVRKMSDAQRQEIEGRLKGEVVPRAGAAAPIPMIAHPPLKLDGNVLSIDPKAAAGGGQSDLVVQRFNVIINGFAGFCDVYVQKKPTVFV